MTSYFGVMASLAFEGVIFSLLIRVPKPSFMLKWQLRFNQKNSEIV